MHDIVSLFTTYLPYFVLVLTLLVFVHEFGHYWVGRRFGIHAEVFSIGFGPELFGWTDRNGTRWKISAIPLGGYVKFLGDTDAASATHDGRPLSPDQRKRAFFTQPLYARAAVVLGGPAANLLFAILLLTGVFYAAGEPYSPAIVAVQADGPAAKAGLQTRRRHRAHQRQARQPLRGHPGRAVPLSGAADVGRIPARRQAA